MTFVRSTSVWAPRLSRSWSSATSRTMRPHGSSRGTCRQSSHVGHLDPPVPTSTDGSRLLFVPREGAAQSELRLGRVALPRRSPEYHAAVVTNMLLGGAFVSRINMSSARRRASPTARGRRSSSCAWPGRFPCRPASSPMPRPSRCATCSWNSTRSAAAARSQRGAVQCPRRAHAWLRARLRDGGAGPRAAAQLALYELPEDTFDVFSDRVSSVTADDVTALARRWLRGDDMQAVIVGEPVASLAGLGAVGLGEPEQRLADDVLAGVRGQDSRDTGNQEHRDTGNQEHRNTGAQEHRSTGAQEHRDGREGGSAKSSAVARLSRTRDLTTEEGLLSLGLNPARPGSVSPLVVEGLPR